MCNRNIFSLFSVYIISFIILSFSFFFFMQQDNIVDKYYYEKLFHHIIFSLVFSLSLSVIPTCIFSVCCGDHTQNTQETQNIIDIERQNTPIEIRDIQRQIEYF